MSETTDTGLAVRQDILSERELDTVQKAGFGMTIQPGQREALLLLARRWQLDPGLDLQVYQGRPWITIDGRVKMARRHPQFAGLSTRPLPAAEKIAWAYPEEDIVVEATIHTRSWGDISARGRVRAAELEMKKDQRGPTPVQSYPSEMAEKRAIARASRLAFGQEVPDDEEWERLVDAANTEASDVERDAARYKRMTDEWFADEFPSPPARDEMKVETTHYVDRTGQPVAGLEAVDTSTGEVIEATTVPGEVSEETAAGHQTMPEPEPTAFDDVEPAPEPPGAAPELRAPPVESADRDEVHAWVQWVRNKMEARQDRRLRANRAIQNLAGTVIVKCLGDGPKRKAEAKYVLRMLTGRTGELAELGYGECEVITEIAGQENSRAWEDWATRVAQVANLMPPG
jgi:hypothetical protein